MPGATRADPGHVLRSGTIAVRAADLNPAVSAHYTRAAVQRVLKRIVTVSSIGLRVAASHGGDGDRHVGGAAPAEHASSRRRRPSMLSASRSRRSPA